MRIQRVAFAIVLLSTLGCGQGDTVTVYPLRSVDPETHYGHNQMTLNPTTYQIGQNVVVAEILGNVTRREDCTVFDRTNWECRYSDSSGRFGMRRGAFWADPGWSDTEYVSRLDHNLVRCQWAVSGSEGAFFGSLRCLLGWE